MKFSTVAAALLPPIALAIVCQNEDFDHDPLSISAATANLALSSLRTRDLQRVDMYWHILVSKPPEEDWTPLFQSQVDFLNDHYKPWGYHLDLKSASYVIDEAWARDIDVDKESKMRELHVGDYQTLNVYAVEGAGGGVCSLPHGESTAISQEMLDRDGCFVPLDIVKSNTSGTLAHEIGHWFGLLHTFQGGCDDDGDGCDDTAPQKEPSNGALAIPRDLNSCPAVDQCGKGPANVKNFMDYTDCSQEFTPCQGGRMHVAWSKYRKSRALAEGVVVKWEELSSPWLGKDGVMSVRFHA